MQFDMSFEFMIVFMVVGLTTFSVAVLLGTLKVYRAETAERDFHSRLEKMPAQSQLEAAEAQLVHKRTDLAEIEARVCELRKEQAEVERHAVDAQHWQQMAEQAKRDYDSLDDKTKKIDEIRDQFEEAANDLASRRQEIDDLVQRRNALGGEIGDIEARREEAEKLNQEIDEKQQRLDEIREEISNQEDLRETMYQARFEVDQLARRKADLENELQKIPEEVKDLEDEKKRLLEEVEELKRIRGDVRALEEGVEHLMSRKSTLEARIEELEKERDGLHAIQTGHVAPGGDEELTEEQEKRALEDLWKEPACLFDNGIAILKDRRDIDTEQQALDDVHQYLKELKLEFHEDLIKRFHTSLKISRVSPLTVLSGISGTGKSLLPQVYSEAMGIPFLKVAVQPRWDSPQDLLGFYNYLEKRYKATEFARALSYMDTNSQNTGHISNPTNDRMLLVLLDEMNLARVEYYFSELLSRLEGRPGPSHVDEALLRMSRIEIDVPLGKGRAPNIYPGHNTLFVGTMNEDESTQALSDKVLDRGNAIQFKRPDRLVTKLEDRKELPLDEFLGFDTWQSWYRPNLSDSKGATLGENLAEINVQLEALGRPFGFRIYQAIYEYAANHPDVDAQGSEDRALSEMMRMRILPKLRGIELSTAAHKAVYEIAALVRRNLGDEELGDAIMQSVSEDDMFTWKG